MALYKYLEVIPRFKPNPYRNDNEKHYIRFKEKYQFEYYDDDDDILKTAREYDAHPRFDVIKIGLKEHKDSYVLNHKEHPRNLERYANHCEKFNIEPNERIMAWCEIYDDLWEHNHEICSIPLERRLGVPNTIVKITYD
jgi:hypothetical protein